MRFFQNVQKIQRKFFGKKEFWKKWAKKYYHKGIHFVQIGHQTGVEYMHFAKRFVMFTFTLVPKPPNFLMKGGCGVEPSPKYHYRRHIFQYLSIIFVIDCKNKFFASVK